MTGSFHFGSINPSDPEMILLDYVQAFGTDSAFSGELTRQLIAYFVRMGANRTCLLRGFLIQFGVPGAEEMGASDLVPSF